MKSIAMRSMTSSALRQVARISFPLRQLHSSSSISASASSSPSSSSALPSTPAIAFDIDGVLLRGKAVLPTAKAALQKVTSLKNGGSHPSGGIPHLFFTNGGGVTEEAKAAQLSKYFDIHIPKEMVVLSHTPMQDLLPRYQNELILTLGMTNVRAVAQHYGFKHVLIPEDIMYKHPELVPHITEKGMPVLKEQAITHYDKELETISAIFVMHDPVEWYRDLQIAMDILTLPRPTTPHIFFSNPDFLFSGKHKHPRLAAGAFRVALMALYKEYTGKDLPVTLYGKPHAVTYKFAEKLLHQQAADLGKRVSHFYGIGDNPASDIRGANDAGSEWSSIFVRSGVIARSKHEREQPQFDEECVLSAVDLIIRQSKQ